MRGIDPLVKCDLGTLEHRSHGHGELFAAVPTEHKARTVGLALKLAIALYAATVRAYRAVRPAEGFKVLAGRFLVVKACLSVCSGVCLCGHSLTPRTAGCASNLRLSS